MKIQSKEKIINCYNDVADNYATNRINELSQKHLDRLFTTLWKESHTKT